MRGLLVRHTKLQKRRSSTAICSRLPDEEQQDDTQAFYHKAFSHADSIKIPFKEKETNVPGASAANLLPWLISSPMRLEISLYSLGLVTGADSEMEVIDIVCIVCLRKLSIRQTSGQQRGQKTSMVGP